MGATKIMNCKNKNNYNECNDWNKYRDYEDMLYQMFSEFYANSKLFYNGLEIKLKHYPPEYDERSCFYHLIYENYDEHKTEENRVPNPDRCKKLHWIKELICNCVVVPCEHILTWENTRHGKRNVLIYCSDLKYLIVLSKRKGYYLLTTAYPVNTKHREDSLLNEYKQTTHSS